MSAPKFLVCFLSVVVSFVFVSSALAAGECVEFNGFLAPDADGDCVVDYDMGEVPEGTQIDNCPNARNGNCDDDPAYCNVDGSYNGINPDTLSDAARRAGYQMDWNRNGIGDACDDYDGDGILDYADNCKTISNPDQNADYCEDSDYDGFDDAVDNCPYIYNTPQIDSDGDNVGDACDNCILKFNPDQADDDGDGFGNLCPEDVQGAMGGIPNQTQSPQYGEGSGSDYIFGQDLTKGNGGCSFTGAGSNASAILAIFMAMASIVFVRRLRR